MKAKIHLDWAADIEGDYTQFIIVGTRGTITLHTLFGFSNNFNQLDYKTVMIESDDGTTIMEVDKVNPQKAFNAQAEYFAKCIVNGKYTHLDCECGYYAVDIIEQLYKNKASNLKM